MVLRSTGTAELNFDNVKVPRANLLGEEGSALKRMLVGLDSARVNIAMGAVGAAQSALDLSIDYARTRTQFGKPIGSFQLVQKLIVDMTVRVEAARALGLRAAAALDCAGRCAHGLLHRQAVRHRGRARGGEHGAAGARRPGLLDRLPDRAHLPRHARRHHPRRHDRGADADRRARDPRHVGHR
jgi:alkylation response protein AidB-like acyl-CoA dehydrogenase